MKILLFGANGFIGKHVKNLLINEGKEVYCATRGQCDFLNLDALKKFLSSLELSHAHVINLAATPKKNSGLQAFKDHIAISCNIASSLKEFDIETFIYSSTFDVYGVHPKLPITENTNINPDNLYGLAKFVSENIFKSDAQLKEKLTILRLPGIYSLNEDDKSFVGFFKRKILNGEFITLENGGDSLRDVVHVDDLSKVIYKIVASGSAYGLINVASGKSISVRSMAEQLATSLGLQPNFGHCKYGSRSFDIEVKLSQESRYLLCDVKSFEDVMMCNNEKDCGK